MLLDQHCGTPQHEVVSKVQSMAVVELLKDKADPESSAVIMDRVLECKWWPEHKDLILQNLSSHVQGRTQVRRKLQDFTALPQFFSETSWSLLTSPTMPQVEKLELIITLATRLGMRCPSEHTLKIVCSFWIVMTHSPEEQMNLTRLHKQKMLQRVKDVWGRFNRRGLVDPPDWIERLPVSPAEVLQKHPNSYKNAFVGNEHPVPLPPEISLAVTAVDRSYSCRATSSLPVPAPATPSDNVTEKVLQFLMKQAMECHTSKPRSDDLVDLRFLQSRPRSLATLCSSHQQLALRDQDSQESSPLPSSSHTANDVRMQARPVPPLLAIEARPVPPLLAIEAGSSPASTAAEHEPSGIIKAWRAPLPTDCGTDREVPEIEIWDLNLLVVDQ
jgi:hypothetical protein